MFFYNEFTNNSSGMVVVRRLTFYVGIPGSGLGFVNNYMKKVQYFCVNYHINSEAKPFCIIIMSGRWRDFFQGI